MQDLKVCPSLLTQGYNTYCPIAVKRMFDGVKVNHIIDYNYCNDNIDDEIINNIKRISLSGVQEKFSAIIKNNSIVLTQQNEQGKYILKPIPNDKTLRFRHNLPANEHLTMQIAKQVFNIETAENAIIFFKNNYPAYITKRFDIYNDDTKIDQEDFASLIGKTKQLNGSDFKYQGSYEDIADQIKLRVAAYQVELVKFFDIIVFNYIFCNNDAHLKNFSLQQTINGDYKLTPAYDLLNACLHVENSNFALNGELSENIEKSDSYKYKNQPNKFDFKNFAHIIGINQKQIDKIINKYLDTSVIPKIETLIDNSFLDAKLKRMYLSSYNERMSRFNRTDKD